MKNIWKSFPIFLNFFGIAFACQGGNQAETAAAVRNLAISNAKPSSINSPDPKPPRAQTSGEPLPQRYMGSQSSASPFSNTGFDQAGGGPVVDSQKDLNCDFESSCCWADFTESANIKWMQGRGPFDNQRIQQNFQTSIAPSGNFATVFNDRTAPEGKGEAWFRSCSIPCTNEDVKVTFKYWQSPGTTLKVCTRDAFDLDAPLMVCQFVPFSSQPGPYTVALPPDRSFEIVFAAGNLKNPGSLVAIDEIRVDAKPCPKSNDPQLCKSLTCSFDDNTKCNYLDMQQGATKPFIVTSGVTGNRDTGVQAPMAGSSKYLGADLNPGEKVVLASSPIEVAVRRKLRFYYFEATQGMSLKVCVNDINNCIWQSNTDVVPQDRNWQMAEIPLSPGTNKIFLVSENTSKNYGAIGLDNMELLSDNGQTISCS